ncbi:unnamed protein product [Ectocarpus sp. 12 AP-2014]
MASFTREKLRPPRIGGPLSLTPSSSSRGRSGGTVGKLKGSSLLAPIITPSWSGAAAAGLVLSGVHGQPSLTPSFIMPSIESTIRLASSDISACCCCSCGDTTFSPREAT